MQIRMLAFSSGEAEMFWLKILENFISCNLTINDDGKSVPENKWFQLLRFWWQFQSILQCCDHPICKQWNVCLGGIMIMQIRDSLMMSQSKRFHGAKQSCISITICEKKTGGSKLGDFHVRQIPFYFINLNPKWD